LGDLSNAQQYEDEFGDLPLMESSSSDTDWAEESEIELDGGEIESGEPENADGKPF